MTAKTIINQEDIGETMSRRSSNSLHRYPSNDKISMKINSPSRPETPVEVQNSDNEHQIIIEPVDLPQSDPHPVKIGHNFLIETSFEEK